ncbi:HNH endonuclease signature motif containing protein [Natrinema thermotolerans]
MGKSDYRERCLKAKGEQCTICDATEDIVVHHVDGDRENNSLGNLEPLCQECHMRIHNYHPEYEVWWRELPAAETPAFPYSEVAQKPFYARGKTWDELEEAIEEEILPELREKGIVNVQKRELHTVLLEMATDKMDQFPERLKEKRREMA